MKNGNMIMATLMVFAMLASVMPVYAASAPGIGVNAQDTNILIQNVKATPSAVDQGGAVNITCDVTANGTMNITSVKISITDPSNNTATYNMTSNTTDPQKSGHYWYENTYNDAGKYTFIINVTDEAGNWNTATGNFTVNDTTAPTISNVAATPSSVVEGNPVNITAQVTDNVGVADVKLTVKKEVAGANNTTSYEIVVNNTAMSENNGTYYYEYTYEVGSYIFEIYAEDAAGNSAVDNSSSNTFEVTADTAAPTISSVTVNPASTKQGGWVNITAEVTDNGVGVDTVMVNITYPDGTHHNESMSLYNGTYYYNATYDAIGTYTFFVWANDTNGNAASSTEGNFEITDGTPPSIANVSATVNNNIVTITAVVTDNPGGAGVGTVAVNITYPDGTHHNETMNLGSNDTYTYTSGALPLGNYTFIIYAYDAATPKPNGPAKASGSFAIVDTEPPVISDISPTDNAEITEGAITFSCSIDDSTTGGSGVNNSTVFVNIDGTNYSMTLVGSYYTYTTEIHTVGTHSFTIYAKDNASNLATSGPYTFTVTDADQPQATPSSDNPTEATLGEKITIKYTVSDPDGIQSVVLHYVVDNGTEKTTPMTLENGTYVAEITLPDSGNQLKYWVVVTDNSGTTTTSPEQTITLKEKAAGLDPILLAGIGIIILVIIIAAAWMMKKKGGKAPSEEGEEEISEEETGEEETEEEETEESEEFEEEI